MPDSSVVSEWLRFAKADLDSAWHLQTMVPVPIEIACYHCQQSAEKALKAFLLANGCEVKKTHDVRFLCNECKTVNADFAQIETMCSRVTVYGSQSRYPFALEIESEDMQLALNDAKKIYDFVGAQINKPIKVQEKKAKMAGKIDKYEIVIGCEIHKERKNR